jgi:hypothetical protein
MRIGFGEIDPPEGHDPTDAQIREAVDACWQNPYCAFTKLPGTSLVCIQGDWSNLVDAKIKSEIAARALGNVRDARYNPLYAHAVHTPRPWGVTALFTEYTGVHEPMPLVWTSKPSFPEPRTTTDSTLVEQNVNRAAIVAEPAGARARAAGAAFASVGDLAKALNRLDPIALEVAARDPQPEIVIEGAAVRKLVGAPWFRSIFPKLSSSWRERLLGALADSILIENHVLSGGRQPIYLADGSYDDLKSIAARTGVTGAAAADLNLVLSVVGLWGEDARRRLRFVDVGTPERSSGLGALFGVRR